MTTVTNEGDLPAREALTIARSYGLNLRQHRDIIRGNIIQARQYGALPGYRSARSIFIDYIGDASVEIRIDSLSARDFEDAAYGPAAGSQRWAEGYADPRADAADFA